MTFHSIAVAENDTKRESVDLDRIHYAIDWARQIIDTQKTKKQHYGKYQRFVRVDTQNIFARALEIVLDHLEGCERNLTYQLIFFRVSIWLKKMLASLRTCERKLQVVLGKTELLRATSKFARAPPNLGNSLSH